MLGPILPTPAFGLTDLPGGVHNPQFHAWWHGIMGFHCYYGATFMIYQRLVYLGRKPRLRHVPLKQPASLMNGFFPPPSGRAAPHGPTARPG